MSIIQYKIGVYLPDLSSKKSYRVYIIFCKLSLWAKKALKSDRVILVAVQTGTGKIDPARKIKPNRGVGQAGYCNISVRARNGSGWYMPPVTKASTRGRDGSNSN